MDELKKYWTMFAKWFKSRTAWGKVAFFVILLAVLSGQIGDALFFAFCWWAFVNFKRQKVKKIEGEVAEAKAYFAPILESKALPVVKVDINLQKDEKCYYAEENISLAEERSVRISRGSGVSGRAMKGLWVHSSGSRSISKPILQKVDTGAIFLTNKRLVYLGKFHNKNIKYDDVLATHQYSDAISLSLGNNGKNEYFFVKNAMLFKGMMSLAPYGDDLKKAKNINIQFDTTN